MIESRMGITRSLTDMPQLAFGSRPSEGHPITDPDELLEGSQVDFITADGLSVYSRYTVSQFGTDKLSGENKHLTLGVDRNSSKNPKWVYGALVMSTMNEGKYDSEYTIDSDMFTLVPYLIYDQRHYGALGFGRGDISLLNDQAPLTTDTSWKFFTLGTRQQVLEVSTATRLYLSGDYFYQQTANDPMTSRSQGNLSGHAKSSYRARIGVAADHHLSEHLLTSPSISYRQEGGDIASDRGVELGFVAKYNNAPWDLSFNYQKTTGTDHNDWSAQSIAISYTHGNTRTYANIDGNTVGYGVSHDLSDNTAVTVDGDNDGTINVNVGTIW